MQQHRSTLTLVDRLSTLPAELLDLIFNQVHLSEKEAMLQDFWDDQQPRVSTHRLISKALLPWTTRAAYQTVFITSGAVLSRFQSTLDQSRAQITSFVKSLFVTGWRGAERPFHEEVQDLLAAFPHLSHIHLGSGSIAEQALNCIGSASFAEKNLKHLKEVELENAWSERDNPYDFRSYINLNCLQNLEHLAITSYCQDSENDESSSLAQISKIKGMFPHIKSLELDVDQSWADGVADDMLSRFPELTSLCIHPQKCPNLSDSLKRVSQKLTHLSISISWNNAETDLIGDALSHFPNLSSLELGYSKHNSLFLAEVAKCRTIRTLKLNQWSHHSLQNIKDLLFGESRWHGLESLILDLFSSSSVEDIFSDPRSPAFCAYLTPVDWQFPSLKKWNLPSWQKELPYEDARKLKKLRSRTKVVLSGNIFKAVEVEELYHAEFRKWDVGRMLWQIQRWQSSADNPLLMVGGSMT